MRLVIASHNAGKVAEFEVLLAPLGWQTVGAGALGLAEPHETGASFEANARLKAEAAASAADLPALADDSGLAVCALDGAPGIHSARWAGPARDFAHAMGRLERALAGTPDPAAKFVCALAFAWPDGRVCVALGEVPGHLVFPPRGRRGFGYDPIFVARGETRTFGEMAADEKDRISHRARALARLKEIHPDGLRAR